MKFSMLKMMYALVLGLLVYSCTQEELFNKEQVPQFELTSPDGYVLAHSHAELIDKLKESVTPIYGEDYEFEIVDVKYLVFDKLTNAEVIYTTSENYVRNAMFFWAHETEMNAAERAIAKPLPVPVCSGDCQEGAPQKTCTTIVNGQTYNYSCKCGTVFDNTSGCSMKLPGSPIGPWHCPGSCKIGENTFACTINYGYLTGDFECYCVIGPDTDCGAPAPVTADTETGGG